MHRKDESVWKLMVMLSDDVEVGQNTGISRTEWDEDMLLVDAFSQMWYIMIMFNEQIC